MSTYHTDLENRWGEFSIIEQMANIGAEIGRSLIAKSNQNKERSLAAFYRAIELIDYTVNDPKNKDSLKELLRMRECLGDYLIGDNIYKSTAESWNKYFFFFNFAVRNSAG